MFDIPRFIGPLPEDWYKDVSWSETNPQPYRCAYCGIRPTWKIASNQPECWPCWYWRKLDGPAARHWKRVTTEFLSNVDVYDLTEFFPKKCHLRRRDAIKMLEFARLLLDSCTAQIEEHDTLYRLN